MVCQEACDTVTVSARGSVVEVAYRLNVQSHIYRLARKQCFPGGMVACRSTIQVYIKGTGRLKRSYALGCILPCLLQVFQRLQLEVCRVIREPPRKGDPRKAGHIKVEKGEPLVLLDWNPSRHSSSAVLRLWN
jgi:hypothetical protein